MFNPKQRLTLALKWVLNPNQYNECLTLIRIMSAQLLICKFAVFTCVSFFFYRCLAWLPWLAGLQFVKTRYWLAVHFISSQKLSNCSAHFYHLHQRTNNCTYPRIIQPIPSAEQQHSVDKMQCRTREGSSQKLQKVHALWWVSCPSLSLSWLKGENERTNSIN